MWFCQMPWLSQLDLRERYLSAFLFSVVPRGTRTRPRFLSCFSSFPWSLRSSRHVSNATHTPPSYTLRYVSSNLLHGFRSFYILPLSYLWMTDVVAALRRWQSILTSLGSESCARVRRLWGVCMLRTGLIAGRTRYAVCTTIRVLDNLRGSVISFSRDLLAVL